jgi:hypothetical protein
MRTSAALAFGVLVAVVPPWSASAQTEAVARRECLQAIRQQGVRGYALDTPRYSHAGETGALTGALVQGASRLEFRCTLDRRGKVTELVVTTPAGPAAER